MSKTKLDTPEKSKCYVIPVSDEELENVTGGFLGIPTFALGGIVALTLGIIMISGIYYDQELYEKEIREAKKVKSLNSSLEGKI